MECHYCHTLNKKFYCRQCLKDKLDSHNGELVPLEAERDKLVNEAAQFVKSTSRMRQLWSEKHNSISNINKATEEKQRINKESEAARKRIQQLRIEIEKRRNRLENVDRCHIEKAMEDCTKDIQHIKQQWYRVHKMTVSARRVLVQEIVSLFDFKPGVVEDSSTMVMESPRPISLTCSNSSSSTNSTTTTTTTTNTLPFAQRDRSLSLHHRNSNSNNNQYQYSSSKYPQQQQQQQQPQPEDLYICGVTLPARVIDVSKYSKEELNAAIGHLIHMFGVIIRYLGVKLPFPIYYKTMYPYIRSTIARQRHSSKMPLFLDDKNLRRFTIGMAMLNYDIAYLCHTQGIEIPLSQVANALQALMACCRSPRLGLQSHISLYQGIRSIDFQLEFHQVLKMTALRYRSGSPMTSELNKELVLNGLLQQQPDATLIGTTSTGDDWYYYDGLLDNSEDDIQDDEEEYYDDDEIMDSHGVNSENWNLVDVMPSFGRPNGEGESIFQLGATIMPGVIGMSRNVIGNMMTSGSASSSTSSQDHYHHHQYTNNNNNQQDESQPQTTTEQILQQYPYYYRRLNAAVRRNGFKFSIPLL